MTNHRRCGLTVDLDDIVSDIPHTPEQIAAWHAVLVQLYEQYPDVGRVEEASLHRRKSLNYDEDKRPLHVTFYLACDTGVPHDELAGAFMMIFGQTPFKEHYKPRQPT